MKPDEEKIQSYIKQKYWKIRFIKNPTQLKKNRIEMEIVKNKNECRGNKGAKSKI